MPEEKTYGDGETADEVIEGLNETLDTVTTSHVQLADKLNRIKQVLFIDPLGPAQYVEALKTIIKIVNEE